MGNQTILGGYRASVASSAVEDRLYNAHHRGAVLGENDCMIFRQAIMVKRISCCHLHDFLI